MSVILNHTPPAANLVSRPTSGLQCLCGLSRLIFQHISRQGTLRTFKRIPPNNFDSHHKIDGTNSVGDHRANGFVECGFDKVTLHLFSSLEMGLKNIELFCSAHTKQLIFLCIWPKSWIILSSRFCSAVYSVVLLSSWITNCISNHFSNITQCFVSHLLSDLLNSLLLMSIFLCKILQILLIFLLSSVLCISLNL